MKRFLKKQAGLPPGTLIHIGEKKTEQVKITVFNYNDTDFQERVVETCEDCCPFKDSPSVTWINIDGIHKTDVIEHVGEFFGIHSLVLEDIMNTQQRPKLEDYDSYLFIVLKMLYFDREDNDIKAEHVSMIVGSNYVISFQECEGDVFEPIRERIRKKKGRVRYMSSDYLAYALIDIIVDNYFIIVEILGEKLESISEKILNEPESNILQDIFSLKRESLWLRKSIWPLRDVINRLESGDSELIREKTLIFLKDVYDHIVQIIETIELSRETIASMVDIYLTHMSNRMNEVMKLLTIVSTIFIPLTFIAGIYGMNFKYMPELEWSWGYAAVLLLMAVLGGAMIFYFKKKKWL